jgi:hypothetical protein
MRMRVARRGGLIGLVATATLVAGALPASAAPGDGSAFGASVSITLLGIGPITAGPFSAASTDGPTEDSLASANVPNVLSAGLITTSATLDETTGQVDSRASTADVAVGILGPANVVEASLVVATCTATQAGNSGSATLADVQLGSLGTVDASPAANTTIDVPGVASITFNEQIDNDDGSLTVNAIHIKLLGGKKHSLAEGDIILSSATCGPAGLPIPLASGAGLWLSLGLLGAAALPIAVLTVRRRRAVTPVVTG